MEGAGLRPPRSRLPFRVVAGEGLRFRGPAGDCQPFSWKQWNQRDGWSLSMQARAPCPQPPDPQLSHNQPASAGFFLAKSRTSPGFALRPTKATQCLNAARLTARMLAAFLITEGLAIPFVCGATSWVPPVPGFVPDGAGFAERKRRDDLMKLALWSPTGDIQISSRASDGRGCPIVDGALGSVPQPFQHLAPRPCRSRGS